MWRDPADWPAFWNRMPPNITNHLPYTAKLENESLELRQEKHRRIHAAFATLREQVQAYQPDALIMIGGDQGDMFDEGNNPIFSIYTGEEPIWGTHVRAPFRAPATDETKVWVKKRAEHA